MIPLIQTYVHNILFPVTKWSDRGNLLLCMGWEEAESEQASNVQYLLSLEVSVTEKKTK